MTFAADRLSPSMLRVLEAVIVLHRRGPVTVRSVCGRLGWRGVNYAWEILRSLRARGLVTWEREHGATIRPTCRLELAGVEAQEQP